MVGKTLSHYRILEELGRGGMGVVYKAEDTKLHRLVAIKVLPVRSLSRPDDRTRFYGEARAAAGLSHPNIAVIHEIAEAALDGAPEWAEPVPFIAMEYVDGTTLDAIIEDEPLSVHAALDIALQVGNGLAAAHQRNIVHRDIKPANIIIGEDGRVRILDFGLAQPVVGSMRDSGSAAAGTVVYMSPEQSRGEAVDHRTDLWSMGVVLYEMLAGHPPFQGNVPQAVQYAILTLKHDPIRSHRLDVPESLEHILDKLLSKFPNERFQTATELVSSLEKVDPDEIATDIQYPLEGTPPLSRNRFRPAAPPPQDYRQARRPMSRNSHLSEKAHTASAASDHSDKAAPSPTPVRARRTTAFYWILGTVSIVLLTAIAVRVLYHAEEPDRRVLRLSIHTPDVDILKVFSVSPDGVYIAASGSDTAGVSEGVFLYETNTGKNRFIPGSEDFTFNARFSPDSRWIALFGGTRGILKAAAGGGNPVMLTDRFAVDGDWLNNDELVINEVSRLSRLRADGGESSTITEDSTLIFMPWGAVDVLPGGTNILVTARIVNQNSAEIGVVNARTGLYNRLRANAHGATYVRSDHLLYTNGTERIGPIYAHAFNPRSLEFKSAPFLLDFGETNRNSFAVSENGILVRREQFSFQPNRTVYWIDETGSRIGDVPIPIAPYGKMSISPDGTRVAAELFRDAEATHDLLIFDLSDHRESRLTFTGENIEPSWTPDGQWIVYTKSENSLDLVRKRADGSGAEERIDLPDGRGKTFEGASFSSDGTKMAVTLLDSSSDGDIDIHVISTSDPSDHVEIRMPGRQLSPSFSLDGRFVAFVSDGELFVKDLMSNSNWAISGRDESVLDPVWSQDGRFIYYRSANMLKRSRIATSPAFSSQTPETVADIGSPFYFALHPDGRRILVSSTMDNDPNRSRYLDIVLNWDEELKRLASPGQ